MNLKVDLERIIWHEIGHLCIDIIQITKYDNAYVDLIELKYNHEAEEKKWSGKVRVINQEIKSNDDLLKSKSHELLSFHLLNLISGSLFELNYLNDYIQDKVSLNDLFSIKNKSGTQDYLDFRKLLNGFCKINSLDKNTFNLEFTSIFSILCEMEFSKMKGFKKDLKQITEKYVDLIICDFNKNHDLGNYSFNFSNSQILDLIEELKIVFEINHFEKFTGCITNNMMLFIGERIK